MHSLGDRTRGAGCRCENMVFVFFSLYGQDLPRSDKTAGINFTQRPKISILARHGRLVAPINVKIGVAKRHVDPLVWAKFHVNRAQGWERDPKYPKFPPFGKYSPHRGEHLDRFGRMLGAFMRQTPLHINVLDLT